MKTKFYIHSPVDPWAVYRTSGKYLGGDVSGINSVQLKDGSWLGVCYINDASVLMQAQGESGVTFFPTFHSNKGISASQVALIPHVQAKSGDAMYDVATTLHSFHAPLGFPYFHPDV